MEEGVGAESGAGAVRLPFVLEKALVGIDVFVLRGVNGTGRGRAIGGPIAIGVLRPKAVEHEGWMCCALGGAGMGIAELRRPGEIEQIVVEAGTGGGQSRACGGNGRGLRCRGWRGFASCDDEK